MSGSKRYSQWWKLTEGKFVAGEFRPVIDAPTQVLVRDLIDSGIEPSAVSGKGSGDADILKIFDTPLPFERIDEWVTWTMKGNEVNH